MGKRAINKLKKQSRLLRNELSKISSVLSSEAPRHVKKKDNIRVAVINARSVSEKLNDLEHCLTMRCPQVLLISETWETQKMCKKLERFCELNELTWLDKSRPANRGGGVAVVVDNRWGHAARLDVDVPEELEMSWAVVTPHDRKDLKVVCGAFYSSTTEGFRPEVGLLQSHIVDVVSSCTARFNDVTFYIGGDLNARDTLENISDVPGLVQVVNFPTRGDSYLDKLVTEAEVVGVQPMPPLAPDPDSNQVASDHSGILADFHLPAKRKRRWITEFRRKITAKQIAAFDTALRGTDWSFLSRIGDSDGVVAAFSKVIKTLIDKFFPLRRIRRKVKEPLWFTEHCRDLWTKANKVYSKEGNSSHYKELHKIFEEALDKAKGDFFNRELEKVSDTDPKRWHKSVRKMATNGCTKSAGPPVVADLEGLSDSAEAELAVDAIESKTACYDLLDVEEICNLHPNGSSNLLSVSQVVEAINGLRVPCGLHPDDPPRPAIKSLASSWAIPLTTVFNTILRTGCWPTAWKEEMTNLIEKKKSPENLSDLRPIAITPIFSKLLESIVRKDILDDILPSLNKQQFGGLKGSSPEHYISGLIQDIFVMKEKKLVPILLMWDFSSAFNCLLHRQVIDSAAALGLRQPLIRLLASYLSGRMTVVRWENARSSPRPCRGGSGQGTLLSMILFLIAVNQLVKNIEAEIKSEEGCHETSSVVRLFVDDTAVLVGVDGRFLPTDISGRKVWSDTDGRIAKYCQVVSDFSNSTGMRLNESKTVALVFDRSVDFPSERIILPDGKISKRVVLETASGELLTKVETAKLLGVVLDSDLKFHSFVKKKVSSANKALWGLRRIKSYSVNQKHLTSAYISYVRSTLEYALPAVWPCLNGDDIDQLERVQKQATKVILSSGWTPLAKDYVDYDTRLEKLGLQRLSDRWSESFDRFAEKLEFDQRFSKYIKHWFTRDTRDPDIYLIPRMTTEHRKTALLRQVIIRLNKLKSTEDQRRRIWNRKYANAVTTSS